MTTPTTFDPDSFTPGERPFHHVSEASTLGIAPSIWPRVISVPSLGNGRPFHLIWVSEMGANYRQDSGCAELTIFND